MTVERIELYSSPNGDRWFLGRDPATGDVFVRHEPAAPSGGEPTHIDVGAFLRRGPRNPEHKALIHLIAMLSGAVPTSAELDLELSRSDSSLLTG
jgi:hypothetical protein